VARAHGGGDLAQALAGESLAAQVPDDTSQQRASCLPFHDRERTIWYMNQVVHVTGTSSASAEQVFRVLADTERWPEWTPFSRGQLEERAPGPDPNGVGALRRFQKGRTTSRERVVAYEPGRRLAYELVTGLPLRGYHSEVTLTPVATGTEITWHSTFRPKVPGTGWIYRMALQKFIGGLVPSLAQRAAALDSHPTPVP
jgi:uncharacterized protein YndB with AHSA1/START domain